MMALRITPTSSSRRVLALEFIRRYFRDYGQSPSFGEIAAGLNIPTSRVGAIVEELEHRGEIIRATGQTRGIMLPEAIHQLSDSQVQLILIRRGWIVVGVNDAPPSPVVK